MKFLSQVFVVPVLLWIDLTSGYSTPPSNTIKKVNTSIHAQNKSRRDLVKSITTNFFIFGSCALSTSASSQAQALELCRPKSRNCIRTTWIPPEDLPKTEVINTVREVINNYPINGQNGVDCSGWNIAADDLEGPSSLSRVEYKSCVGPAAVTINLGRPFVDDLKVEIEDKERIQVQIRSSSRMGSSDLFVNKKRVEFLGEALRSKGWIIPPVKY